MTKLCLSCGGTGLVGSHPAAVVWFNGQRLPPKIGRMLGCLAAHHGALVRKDALIIVIWDDSEPDAAENKLAVYAWRLRQILAPTGRSLESVWGLGYRLAGPPLDPDLMMPPAEPAAVRPRWPGDRPVGGTRRAGGARRAGGDRRGETLEPRIVSASVLPPWGAA
jgi:hypothetical protein